MSTYGNVDDTQFEGLSSLVRLSGVSIPARARFVGETMLGATLSSLSVGLLSGSLGATFFAASVGPLAPFLVGSGVGYTFGLFYQWRLAKRRALLFCEQYPRLMAYALRTEWDMRDAPTTSPELTAWIRKGGLSRVSNSMLAANTCAAAVEEIRERSRQRIVDGYADLLDEEDA